MAHGKGAWFFSGMAVAAVAATLSLAGCTTAPVEDVAAGQGRSGQPVDTGTYPNLNIPRQAAATQLTDDETKAKLASLNAAQSRQGTGASASTASAEERRRLQLSQDEQAETLKVIEGQKANPQ